MTTTQPRLSRRQWLAGAGRYSALGLAASPFFQAAHGAAAGASDYKALVCVFLAGGNDAFNTVLATDPASWSAYNGARRIGNASIALAEPGMGKVAAATAGSSAALGGVLAITPDTQQAGRSFALHPRLTAVRQMFEQGRAAVVANVGTLVEPVGRDDFLARRSRLPPRLYSHNDQQSVWQSSLPEGAQTGWGGAMMDIFAPSNGAAADLSAISVAGNSVWLSGRKVNASQLDPSGVVVVGSSLGSFKPLLAQVQQALRQPRTDLLEQDHVAMMARSMANAERMAAALPPLGPGGVPAPGTYISPVTGQPTANPLAQQLAMVARTISARTALGARRQVFFVSLPGFDTHADQSRSHAELMARLDAALAYFQDTLAVLPGGDARGQVTTFTASDFGRALQSNGDGSDHGWGGHHFVIGGAVKGREIYGRFPAIGLQTDADAGHGALIPTVATEQYAASLASWFGVADAQLDGLFPNLRNFGAARTLPMFRA